MSGLNKTLAGLTAAVALGGVTQATADIYTEAANENMPQKEVLVERFNKQAPAITQAVIDGAVQYLQQNAPEVKNNQIAVGAYAEKMSKRLLTPGDELTHKMPPKAAQACLMIYAGGLMENSKSMISAVHKAEGQLKGLAVQVMRAENQTQYPGLERQLRAGMGVKLVNMDINANLGDALLTTAQACFDMVKAINTGDAGAKAAAQKDGKEGLFLIQNYANPFDFSEAEAASLAQNVPELEHIMKLPKAERDKRIEQYVMTTDAGARAEVYMKVFVRQNPHAGDRAQSSARAVAPQANTGARQAQVSNPKLNIGAQM